MEIRLTQTVKKGGCAAKLPAGQLRQILSKLELPKSDDLIVGTENLDDAALWNVGDNRLLIQTLDFFTPIVDDPFDFGAIAAANAISDIYAMGGRPFMALSILAFPTAALPIEILEPLMQGALSVIREAGAVLGGGHTIDDETLKLGFSVSGWVNKDKAWKNSGARAGDDLILTKPLGTGTITSALKNGMASKESLDSAIESMKTLNAIPDKLEGISVHAATDITGFGLAGHLLQMMQASGTAAEVATQELPTLEGARELLEREVLNRAHRTNFDYVKDSVDSSNISQTDTWLTVDPQTSGGILLAVDPKDTGEVLKRLSKNFPNVFRIGRVHEQRALNKRIVFHPLF